MDQTEHVLITTVDVVQANLTSSAFLRTECGPAGDAIDVLNTTTLALPIQSNPENTLEYHIGVQETLRICLHHARVR